jgi:hypothetical protein
MITLQTLCQSIYDWPSSTALRESDNAYPLIETVHVLGISLIAGSLVTVDLRLIGALFREQPVTSVTRMLLPWAWCGFALMVVTGVPLFAAQAAKLYDNPAFRVKLTLLVAAGLNALLFHLTTYRRARDWELGVPPLSARAFAATSILLWSGIIVAGRLIAVFHAH